MRLHKLSTSRSVATIQHGDNFVVNSAAAATLKLQIPENRCLCRFMVIDMIPGYDVISGTDWMRKHDVDSHCGKNPTESHLRLCKSKCVLWPMRAQQGEFASDPRSSRTSAQLAAKLLMCPRFASATPFVFPTRKDDSGPHTPAVMKVGICDHQAKTKTIGSSL